MRTTALILLLSVVAVGAALLPGARPAAAAGAIALTTGQNFTCALTTEGGVKCWGLGLSGQLGDGTTERRLMPVDVLSAPGGPPLEGVTAITSGTSFACALMTSGGVKCWGWNHRGQLGDGTQTPRNTPVDVCQEYDAKAFLCIETLSNVTAISAGGGHACALVSDGHLKCWGNGASGELGDGTGGRSSGGVAVPLTGGDGESPSESFRTTPVEVCQDYDKVAKACGEQLSGVVSVSSGGGYTCALMPATRVKCWGSNIVGQLGDGAPLGSILDPITQPTPVDVCETYSDVEERCTEVFTGAATVVAGSLHTCALTTSGGVKCWGDSVGGMLGNGGDLCTTGFPAGCVTPVDVCGDSECSEPLSGVSAVTAGSAHGCAVLVAGGVRCWGRNVPYGAIGDDRGCRFTCETPVDVCAGGEPDPCDALLANVTAIAAKNALHSCALLEDGRVKCWGKNFNGQLGDGTRGASGPPTYCDCRMTPVSVLGIDAEPLLGDVDCSAGRTSIDALLLLQVSAGLLGTLPCPKNADVNGDGSVNSIDAALVLQHIAGLMPGVL